MSVLFFILYMGCLLGVVAFYERQNSELESWANALSNECAALHRQVATLRGSSWSS